jgi:hypothetical protein
MRNAALTLTLAGMCLVARPLAGQQSPDTVAVPDSLDARVGLAVAGTLLTNIVCWTFNEFYQSKKDISRISPFSWKGSTGSLEWDDNPFWNNQFFHPYQGSFYYNAARVNGAGFWFSALATTVGSVAWECCSERRPFSYNDPINTILGGVAFGEVQYRASSALLGAAKNRSGWVSYPLKIFASALNPQRALARGVFHRWDEWDGPNRVPDNWGASIGLGVGPAGKHLFFPVEFRIGDLASENSGPNGTSMLGEYRPYDILTVRAQFNVAGNIWDRIETQAVIAPVGQSHSRPDDGLGTNASAVAIVHNFDYRDGTASELDIDHYKLGAQGIGLAGMLSARRSTWQLEFRSELDGVFASLNSRYAHYKGLQPERYREYDYTLGGMARLRADVSIPETLYLELHARGTRLRTLNGSNEVRDDTTNVVVARYDALHHLANLEARARVRVGATIDVLLGKEPEWLGWVNDLYLGAEWTYDLRNSSYTPHADGDGVFPIERLGERQRQHRLQATLTWDAVSIRAEQR